MTKLEEAYLKFSQNYASDSSLYSWKSHKNLGTTERKMTGEFS